MSRTLLSILALGMLVAPSLAKTWYVGGSGADFDEIQSAIDAAQDGDVILVRPGSYHTFTVWKGVMVRASSTPFAVTMTPPDRVLIQDISASKRAGIAGMSIAYNPTGYYSSYELVAVHASAGEVVLEDLSLTINDTNFLYAAVDPLLIQDCSNVSITGLVATREANISSNAGVRIERSSVRISRATVKVGEQLNPGTTGAAAIGVTDSYAVISGMDLEGGKGGEASSFYYLCEHGGRGGDAVAATNSQVFLVGYYPRYSHRLQGGDGGDSPSYVYCEGGDGGDGFRGDGAQVSNVTLLGGSGGTGPDGNGLPGLPWEGTLTESNVVPYLASTGDLHPGGTFYLSLDVVDAGALVIVLSEHQGFVPIWGNAGLPLSAIPGGRFVTFYAGHLNAFGHAGLPLVLPGDPFLSGIALSAQCAELLDAGGFILSNATTNVIAE